MSKSTVLRFTTLACSALLSFGIAPIFADEPKADAPSTTAAAKKAFDPSRRVPDYFGQIGLSPEQKETIYKIRAKHAEKIEVLQKQIAVIQGEMLAECEVQLNDTQKKLLEFRRSNSAKAKKSQVSKSIETESKSSAKSSD